MRVLKSAVIMVAFLGLTVPVVAQDDDPGRVAKSYKIAVKPAEALQFETAFREHLKLGAQNNEPWAWHTWQIVNGRDFGQIIVRSYGHRWEDFDTRAEHDRLDRANFMATVAPHVKSISSTLETVEPALSNWPANRGRPALVEMTEFELNYDGVRDFVAAVEMIHETLIAKDPSRHYVWFSTVNGSDGPTMTLAIPHDNWADFNTDDEPSVWKILEEVHGASKAQALRETIGRSVRSEQSYILQLRKDLSYEPAQ